MKTNSILLKEAHLAEQGNTSEAEGTLCILDKEVSDLTIEELEMVGDGITPCIPTIFDL